MLGELNEKELKELFESLENDFILYEKTLKQFKEIRDNIRKKFKNVIYESKQDVLYEFDKNYEFDFLVHGNDIRIEGIDFEILK